MLDDRLKWNHHIDFLCKKLSKLNGILYLVRNSLTPEALKLIYYSLIYSNLIYGVTAWGGPYQTHLDPVRKVQKRIVRTISCERRDAHTIPIFNNLHLLKFDHVYKLFISILVFKCLKLNYVSDLCTPIANIHQRTRQAMHDLRRPPSRLALLDKSVLDQMPVIWNSLPNHLKTIDTLEQFKRELKLYLYHCQSLEV